MTFTPEETDKIKRMFMFLINLKHKQTDGHGGFHLFDIRPILEELEKEGKVISRPTLHNKKYFLKPKN